MTTGMEDNGVRINARHCIPADDFGYPSVTISARYNTDTSATPQEVWGTTDDEVAIWRKTNYQVNGQPLTLVVANWRYPRDPNSEGSLSAWCPWYGKTGDENKLSSFCTRLSLCQWENGVTTSTSINAPIVNAPCIIKSGIGLYGLIAQANQSPNESQTTASNPDHDPAHRFTTFHLGDPHTYQLFDNFLEPGESDDSIMPSDTSGTIPVNPRVVNTNNTNTLIPQHAGGIVFQFSTLSPQLQTNLAGGDLYFKILDKYYNDNSGQYIVYLKSGITTYDSSPIQILVDQVKKNFLGTTTDGQGTDSNWQQGANLSNAKTGLIANLFNSILIQPAYQNVVSILLTIYVFLTAAAYLIGTLRITHTELVIRVIKIAIVSVLLNPSYGWQFFNDNLFSLFLDGSEFIAYQIQSAASTGPSQGSILHLFVAKQTLAKVLALTFTSWTGPLFALLYIIAFVFLVCVSVRNAILYLSSLVMICIIIALGPIFICFMLFGFTRSLFENWLKQLTSYSLQAVILLAIEAFISVELSHQIYANLGFTVCETYFPNLGPAFEALKLFDKNAPSTSLFSWYVPYPLKAGQFNNQKINIQVPEAHYQLDSNGLKTSNYCEAYECSEDRYYDFPFLDPKSPEDMQRLQNFFNGDFAQLSGILHLIMLIYLMHKLNQSAVSMANAITGTDANQANIAHAAMASYAPLVDKPYEAAMKHVHESKAYKAYDSLRTDGSNTIKAVVNAPKSLAKFAWNSHKNKKYKAEADSLFDAQNPNISPDKVYEINKTTHESYQTQEKGLQEKLNTYSKETQSAQSSLESATKAREKATSDVSFSKSITNLTTQKREQLIQAEQLAIAKEQKAKAKYTALSQKETATKTTLDNTTKAREAVEKTLRDFEANKAKNPTEHQKKEDYAKRKKEEFRQSYIEMARKRDKHGSFLTRNMSLFGGNVNTIASDLHKIGKQLDNSLVAKIHRGDYISAGYEGIESLGAKLFGINERYDFHDPTQRTNLEQQKEAAERKRFEDTRQEVEMLIHKNRGLDILNPENIAKLKAQGRTADAAKYEQLAKDSLEAHLNEIFTNGMPIKADYAAMQLPNGEPDWDKIRKAEREDAKYKDETKPPRMGDKYVRDLMTEKEFTAANLKFDQIERNMLKHDEYLRIPNPNGKGSIDTRDLYKGKTDPESVAIVKALDEREKMIKDAVERERERLYLNYYGIPKPKTSQTPKAPKAPTTPSQSGPTQPV